MMKHFFAAFALCLLVFAVGGQVHADANNFIIDRFAADYTLSNSNKHGELHIVEHIDVTFMDSNHGILRALPSSYKGNSLHLHVNSVSSRMGTPSAYTISNSNGNVELKIGDPNRTVTGVQEYDIDYTVDNVIGFYGDHDELYWDINGDQWIQLTKAVSVIVHLPADLKLSSQTPLCYTGSYGSKASDCTITSEDGVHDVSMYTNGLLSSKQTATIVVGFQKGYFVPVPLNEKATQYGKVAAEILALPLVIGVISFSTWWRKGRDGRGRGTIVPQYGPPDNLTPIEVGTLMTYKIDNKYFSATIIDLAVRHYIKIIEEKQDRKILKDKLSYTLEIVNADFSALTTFEASVLQGIFPAGQVGSQVKVEDLKNSFYKTVKTVSTTVEEGMTTKGYFNSNPLKAGALLHGLGAACFVFLFFFRPPAPKLDVSIAISGLIAILFGFLMKARTTKGALAKEEAEGLKLYLKTAEADQLKMTQAPNAAYAENRDAPAKTVNLF
jgi:hypothetical protein